MGAARRTIDRFGPSLALALYVALIAASVVGALSPLDDLIRDWRFGLHQRPATNSVVFVDIDSRSLHEVGVWPWPRHLHAELLNNLMELGASAVAFDIDFSAASSEAEDNALETALRDAGGYAYLAAFQQQRSTDGTIASNLPLARFRQYADPVAVNVGLEANGVVRTYPFAMGIGDRSVPSLAAIFAGARGPAGASFKVDHSIDPSAVTRISAADILARRVNPGLVQDKQVVIGASAVELRDFFVVPRNGVVPGALLQILATETLKQGRVLVPIGLWPALLGVFLIGAISVATRRRLPLWIAVPLAPAAILVAEASAALLQINSALLLDTAAIDLAAAVFALQALLEEIRRRGEKHREAARERDAIRVILDRVVSDNFDGVVVVRGDHRIVAASAAAESLLGAPLPGSRMDESLPPALVAPIAHCLAAEQTDVTPRPLEIKLVSPAGTRVLEYVTTRSDVRLGPTETPVACLTFRDITARRAAEDRLVYLGRHDQMTGALSRATLVDEITQALDAGRDVGVVMIDLRRFRAINDTLGHSQGDLLLKEVVTRLKTMGPDAVSRLGGDSFAMLVPAIEADRLSGYCESITRWLAFPYQLADGHQAIVAASAGATTSLISGRNAETLLSHADMALSAAKDGGVAKDVMLFASEMDRRLRQRQAMDAALRKALAKQEFTLAFQPQVDLRGSRIIGAEALLRWHHSELGVVSPVEFVAAAEETGLIVELGRWVLETACREAAKWPGDIRIAVNVSPVQFELSDVVADVRGALTGSGLPASRLDIEITEGVFVRNAAAVTGTLQTIRDLGIGIALDDFGTGYSSLGYLGKLPVDKIKIDQSFVKRLPEDDEAAVIVRTVLALSAALGKSVIAEGIETEAQAALLRDAGCLIGQGYLFGRPMTAEALAVQLGKEPRAFARSA